MIATIIAAPVRFVGIDFEGGGRHSLREHLAEEPRGNPQIAGALSGLDTPGHGAPIFEADRKCKYIFPGVC